MVNGKKIVVCLPAYNAGKTLERTYNEIPAGIVDEVLLVDDYSLDDTVRVAEALGIRHILSHNRNKGYGANQKTCYSKALSLGADIVILLHPDYQYNPAIIPSMVDLVANGVYPVVLASRILGKGALRYGMPLYKYIANRLLTFIQNLLVGQKLSEYHTGYRAYSVNALTAVNFQSNSDNFIFDNQILAQMIYKGFAIGEVSCPAKYFTDASSISFLRSIEYGIGVLQTSIRYRLSKWGLLKSKLFA